MVIVFLLFHLCPFSQLSIAHCQLSILKVVVKVARYLLIQMRTVFTNHIMQMAGINEIIGICIRIHTGFQESQAVLPNNNRIDISVDQQQMSLQITCFQFQVGIPITLDVYKRQLPDHHVGRGDARLQSAHDTERCLQRGEELYPQRFRNRLSRLAESRTQHARSDAQGHRMATGTRV